MKKKNNLKRKNIAVVIIFLVLFLCMSRLIYASTVEKTTIQCKDENMYDALKIALNKDIDIGDANKANLTIKIPTMKIQEYVQINLEDKSISDITGIEKLTALKSINLGKNNLTNIDLLKEIEGIEELSLHDNKHLGDNLSNVLPNLKKIAILNISNTGLKDIGFIKNMTSLKELYMANGSFSGLNEIENLNLLKLDVSGNQSIRTIESIIKVKGLTSLNISNTGIQKLEINEYFGIFNLTKLKELYVRGIDVESLDPILKTIETEGEEEEQEEKVYLQNIEILDISYIRRNENSYVGIPSFGSLSKLKNLRILYMQGNMLTDINEIYAIENLQEVNLKENKIEDLSGLVELCTETDEDGNEYVYVNNWIKAKVIDLSHNEIAGNSDIPNVEMFRYLNGRVDISYLDLSANHIYNTSNVEWVKGTLKLQDQEVRMSVYKKHTGVDHYIILLDIFQNAKNPNSRLYSKDVKYTTTGCKMNEDKNYQQVGMFNVIIDKEKNEEDEMYVELSGGIADGSKLRIYFTEDSYYGMDSLVFNDNNLKQHIFYELAKQDPAPKYLISAQNIINVYHENVQRIENLDLSNKDIFDLTGMENLDQLRVLNISKNQKITSIEPLKNGNPLEKLNASETSIKDNLQPIEGKNQLRELIINNIGLTKLDSIITLVKNQKEINYDELVLSELDVSANLLESINGVQEISSLTKLSATRNKLAEIPDLTQLERLERLTLYSNQISKIPKVEGLNNLKYIFLSDNRIEDISSLSKLNSIIELELNNNLLDDEDISNLQNVKISRNLKISGNKIENIDVLKNSIGSVTELDISKNKIGNVKVIDDRFSSNGTLTANSQKIIAFIKSNDQKEVEIELPQIFNAAKTQNSYFYTAEEFETQNCTLSGNKIKIKLDEIAEKVAVVKIIGGKAKDTELVVATPIIPKINYSTTDWTNGNVEATITFNKKNITIKNNDGKNKYIFEKNGKFTFEFIDEYGVEGNSEAEVKWIDKEPPTIKGVENQKVYTEGVTPIISDNNTTVNVTLKKNNVKVENYKAGTKIEEVGKYELIATDVAKNETKVSFEIKEKTVEPNPEPEPESKDIESETYTIDKDKNIISKVKTKTTVQQFKKNVLNIADSEILDKDNKPLDSSKYIGTGCKVKTKDKEYKIAVEGDLNGTGDLELNDLAQAQKIYTQLIKDDELKKIALDLNQNQKLDLNDLAKLQKIYIGK